jgi:SAM-dependent methyltransferase
MYILSAIKRTGKTIIFFPKRVGIFFSFLAQWFRFRSKNDKRFRLRYRDLHPCLKDRVTTTPFDQHYTYHPAWAARVLARTRPKLHIDISSILNFSAVTSAFIPIKFYDYRPAHLQLNNFESDFADLKQLPFENNSIESVSCMHTIEHIGLGRYGDDLDVKGDVKAIDELKRVTKPNGDILFVTPVGKPKLEFNAHRIYSYEQIVDYFEGCELIEFSLIPDKGGLILNAEPGSVKDQKYGCGCFWFKKKLV